MQSVMLPAKIFRLMHRPQQTQHSQSDQEMLMVTMMAAKKLEVPKGQTSLLPLSKR